MTPRFPPGTARRFPQLLLGLFLYGIGIALIVRGQIGSSPWDVLTQGISRHVPLIFGAITVITSVLVLLLWIPLRQRPGLGTVLNVLLVGPSADVGLLLIPADQELWLRIGLFSLGLLVLASATGLYIGAHYGPGPRDGLMTGLHRITGWPIWVGRSGVEVVVLGTGWLLGGPVGFGTLAFAALIGPLCQRTIPLFAAPRPAPAAERAPAIEPAPSPAPAPGESATPTSPSPTI